MNRVLIIVCLVVSLATVLCGFAPGQSQSANPATPMAASPKAEDQVVQLERDGWQQMRRGTSPGCAGLSPMISSVAAPMDMCSANRTAFLKAAGQAALRERLREQPAFAFWRYRRADGFH